MWGENNGKNTIVNFDHLICLNSPDMPHGVAMTSMQPLIENGNHNQIEYICL